MDGTRWSRRRFLSLPLAGGFAGALLREEALAGSSRPFEADLGVLFGLVTLSLRGSLDREIDRTAGRYRVTMTGEGPGVSARTEGAGIIRDGRFKPTALVSTHIVKGRENRTSLVYDYDRGLVEYHSVGYTFLLGRRRQADDVVRLAPGQHVDDIFSAELNFASNKLDLDRNGAYRVTVVRRARPANEGPDDVSPDGYRAELTDLRFHVAPDATDGRLTARLDLTGFSAWARPAQPARVAFARDRHVQSVESSMILGTTFTLRLAPFG